MTKATKSGSTGKKSAGTKSAASKIIATGTAATKPIAARAKAPAPHANRNGAAAPSPESKPAVPGKSANTAGPESKPSKIGTVMTLMQRDGGATLDELTRATGWLPHTTRAALTGLRKKGYAIERAKRDDTSCYHLTPSA